MRNRNENSRYGKLEGNSQYFDHNGTTVRIATHMPMCPRSMGNDLNAIIPNGYSNETTPMLSKDGCRERRGRSYRRNRIRDRQFELVLTIAEEVIEANAI